MTRCTAHPAFEADYCPSCGTSTVIGADADKTIHTVVARSTGVLIEIIQLGTPGDDGEKWGARCVEHGWTVYTPTRRVAHAEGRTPEDWCEGCDAEGDVEFVAEFALDA